MKSFFQSLFAQSEVGQDRLFFVETALISDKVDSKSGIITEIRLSEEAAFEEFILSEKPKIVNVKRGANKVVQDLEIDFENPGAVLHKLEDIKKRRKTVSILHIDVKKNAFLYGENNGLEITELSDKMVLLEGEEADAFFKVSSEAVNALIAEL